MYLGPFYINTKELFLILAAILLFLAMRFGWGVYWFDKRELLALVLIMFITKTLLPFLQNEAFFMMAMVAIFLTLYLTIFQVLIFYFLSFGLLRIMKLI